MATFRTTKLYCDKHLRDKWWPEPLAHQWMLQYPGLFDFDDYRQTDSQHEKHFYEWYVAIHLFQRDRSISLVEKYPYPSNPVKYERYIALIDDAKRAQLDALCKRCDGVQLPDLMVIAGDHRTVSFAEVKGARDSLHAKQPEMLDGLLAMGFDVELVEVEPRDVLIERDAWRPKKKAVKFPDPENPLSIP